MSGPESQWVAHQVCQVHRLGGHVWAHEPVVPFPAQTSGPGDEQHTGSNQWGHLPVWGLPDHAGRPWLPGQENLAKAPGRLGHRRGRNLQCAGKLRLGLASEDGQEQSSTSRAACTQTCCCRSDWCPTM